MMPTLSSIFQPTPHLALDLMRTTPIACGARTARTARTIGTTLCTVMLLGLLAACSPDDQSELKTWMQQARAKTPATIAKVVPPLPYVPVSYTASNDVHPFDSDKLKDALLKQRESAGGKQYQPDLSRKRESLEAFPVDTLRMMGFMMNVKDKQAVAQVLAGAAMYNVRVGQYLGTDFGKIVQLSETEIVLNERVQDSAGIWTERTTRIPLSVAAGKEIKQ